MNNSFIAQNNIDDEELDEKPLLKSREADLIKIITALNKVQNTEEWQTLKEFVFDGVVESLDRRLMIEAKKDDPDKLELARLNGQLVWARKYADLNEFTQILRQELEGIRQKLQE